MSTLNDVYKKYALYKFSKNIQSRNSKIYIGKTANDNDVCIKIYNITKDSTNKIQAHPEDILKEIATLKKLNHKNITNIDFAIKTKNYIVTVSPLYIIDLYTYINDHHRMQVKHVCEIIHQLSDGIEYLHNNKIIHGDLKVENVMIDSNYDIKIIDLEFASELDGKKHHSKFGTHYCYAPEMKSRKYGGYTESIDYYTYGLIIEECYMGLRKDKKHLNLNPILVDFITKLKTPNPINRLGYINNTFSMNEVRKHEIFKNPHEFDDEFKNNMYLSQPNHCTTISKYLILNPNILKFIKP